jgi:uncharacterized membrane protein YfcA
LDFRKKTSPVLSFLSFALAKTGKIAGKFCSPLDRTQEMEILLFVAIGLIIGSFSGALGIGGGVLLVPALIWFCGFDPRKAQGTTLAILIPPIGLPAAYAYYCADRVDLKAALWIAGTFAAGAYLGAALVLRLEDPASLRLAFGLVMMFIAMRFIVTSDSEAANAAAGLTATVLAWLGYVGLRALGRKHLRPPGLGEQIRSMKEQGHGEPDYHI